MALFANVANRSKMNSLRMARPSRHKSVYTRKIEQKIKETKQKYDVQAIQSLRGQNVQRTIRRGGDPQRDWMRWRQPENAILDLLTPEAKKQLLDAGLKIKAETAGGIASLTAPSINGCCLCVCDYKLAF